MRWEYFGPPHNFQSNIDSNVYFGDGTTPIPCIFGGVQITCPNQFFPQNSTYYSYEAGSVFPGDNSRVWDKDLHKFLPRIGFCLAFHANPKFVLPGWGWALYS